MKEWEKLTNEALCLEYQQTKSNELFEYFLERNRRLGLSFAQKYLQIFPQYEDDFHQAIRVAMWRCMIKYDATYETTFTTLFYYYVRHECQAVVRMRHSIRLPRYVWQQLNRFEEEHPDRLYSLRSLDYDYNDGSEDEESTLADLICDKGPSPEELFIRSSTEKKLIQTIDTYLRPSEAIAIKKYFGLDGNSPHTLQQIGNEYNLSRERVRQLVKKGLNKLKARRRLIDE